MNSDDKFVIWSDGSFTSMGIDASEASLFTGNSKLLIKDPVSVIFSTAEVMNDQTGQMEPRLNFEMIPYLFGALLTEGENTWEIDARHVLKNHAVSPVLRSIYYNTIAMTNHVKRNDDGEVEVTQNA